MKRILSFVLIISLMIPSISFGQAVQKKSQADLRFFVEVLDYIEAHYPFEVEESKLIESALKGMLSSVDSYSNYYTKEEAEPLYQSMTGVFTGIGVQIKEEEGFVVVDRVIKGQPAEKAGIRSGDIIIAIDEVDAKNIGIGQVSKMIKGPKGSNVSIKVKRGEEILDILVKRDIIKTASSEGYIIEETDIGYIYIKEFNKGLGQEIDEILKEFTSKGSKKVIIDVRDNPGGLLDEAVSLSAKFVGRGSIVHIREKNKPLLTHFGTKNKPDLDLVVLVNENSASASEIFAGAVKDKKAGSLIGQKTFGKGTVQSLMPLSDGSILKLTIAEYLTPNKTSINGIGIEPDIKVKNSETEDLQLKKAIEVLDK